MIICNSKSQIHSLGYGLHTHDRLMQSSCQMLVLPVSSSGNLQDTVVSRCMRLYPDNYQNYHRACMDGRLRPGMCLIIKRQRELSGLSATTNSDTLTYIANLVVTDFPHHPTRRQWLSDSLNDFCTQVLPLIQNKGLKRIAIHARPLIYPRHDQQASKFAKQRQSNKQSPPVTSADLKAPILAWDTDIQPILECKLQPLPKVRIDIHQ